MRRLVKRSRVAVVAVGLLALAVLAAIASAGGFATAAAGLGRERAVGDPISLARWQVTVLSAEVIDDEGGRQVDPRVIVRVDVTNLTRTTETLPSTLVTLVGLPVGDTSEPVARSATGDRRVQYDPDLREPVALGVTYPKGARLELPPTIRVVVSDERYSVGFLVSDWVIAGAAAHVDVPLVDRRRHG